MKAIMVVLAALVCVSCGGPLDQPVVVTLVDIHSRTKLCTRSEEGCTQTHYNLRFKDATGNEYLFHGWTQSVNGKAELDSRFQIGREFSTFTDKDHNCLAILKQINFSNPRGYWCFVQFCGGGGLGECGMWGGTFD